MNNYFLCEYPNCGAIFSSDLELSEHKNVHNCLEMTNEYRRILKRKLQENVIFINNNKHLKSEKESKTNEKEDKQTDRSRDERITEILKSLLTETVHLQKRIQCDFPVCGQRFDTELEYFSHKIIHTNMNCLEPRNLVKIEDQELNKWKYSCLWPHCSYSSCDKTQILLHIRSHFCNNPYKCEYNNCFMRFSKRYLYRTHQSSHYYHIIQQIDNQFKYTCDWSQCEYNTNDILDINKHIETHLSQMTFKCNQINCNQRFSSQSMLNNHGLSHSNYDPKMIDLSYFFSKRILTNVEIYVCEWPQCNYNSNLDFVTMALHIQQHYSPSNQIKS